MLLIIFSLLLPASAQRPSIVFMDIVTAGGSGIGYKRFPSEQEAIYDAFKHSKSQFAFPELQTTPLKGRGAPGVALLDVDRDGDLDVYVTNGPGHANSLFSNQWVESGTLTFFDIAQRTQVEVRDQDSTGVCFGDIDNDGDEDVFVLGRAEPNRLLEQRDGVFVDITSQSGFGGGNLTSTSCSMGDINGDGLLDVAVSNAFDWTTAQAITLVPVALNQPNQLFQNQGNNHFADVSESSGFLNVYLPPGAPDDAATISWAIAMVDYDLDGDIDIMHADDQGAIPPARLGGLDRGFLQLFENDGAGHFINVTEALGLDRPGSWMGLSFGDFDLNGTLDVFSTNFGNQFSAGITGNTERTHSEDSRWLLQQPNALFSDSVDQEFTNTPFGWGTSVADYDNDGDSDIIFHGGHEAGLGVVTNPGAILNNDGQANFSRDAMALAGSTNHIRRTVHGMAVGDLNNDGFVDIVSVSNLNIPNSVPLFPVPSLGGDFDQDAFFVASFNPIDAQGSGFVWAGFEFDNGTLSIEVSSADNDQNWVVVEALGTTGVTSEGQVNRNGIGATVLFTPKGLPTNIKPILGGSSYASQDALYAYFGMGEATMGDVEILWPSGVRNRLLNVKAGDRILFPEIPCSIEVELSTNYLGCLNRALDELLILSIIDSSMRERLFQSAITTP